MLHIGADVGGMGLAPSGGAWVSGLISIPR
jgi:hypothetical protein